MNNIDQSLHDGPPPAFRGGIIADTMGSGKSLTMISLITHNVCFQNIDVNLYNSGTTRTTLLVVPATGKHLYALPISKLKLTKRSIKSLEDRVF
jgi:hypothetical protein